MTEYLIDCRMLGEREETHAYIAGMLDFPAYYGRNLDALYDSLGDMPGCRIVLCHTSAVPGEGYTANVLETIREAARDFKKLELAEKQ